MSRFFVGDQAIVSTIHGMLTGNSRDPRGFCIELRRKLEQKQEILPSFSEERKNGSSVLD